MKFELPPCNLHSVIDCMFRKPGNINVNATGRRVKKRNSLENSSFPFLNQGSTDDVKYAILLILKWSFTLLFV